MQETRSCYRRNNAGSSRWNSPGLYTPYGPLGKASYRRFRKYMGAILGYAVSLGAKGAVKKATLELRQPPETLAVDPCLNNVPKDGFGTGSRPIHRRSLFGSNPKTCSLAGDSCACTDRPRNNVHGPRLGLRSDRRLRVSCSRATQDAARSCQANRPYEPIAT